MNGFQPTSFMMHLSAPRLGFRFPQRAHDHNFSLTRPQISQVFLTSPSIGDKKEGAGLLFVRL